MIRSLIVALIVLAAIMIPASATVITAENVNQYSVSADPGTVLYQIIIDGLPFGTNQSHILNYQGQSFLLEINTWTDYGLWKNADVRLTLPNGTVQKSHTSATSILTTYKTTIQPIFTQAESLTVAFLKVDLYVGLTPASVQFSAAPVGWTPQGSIPFSAASGHFTGGQTSTVYVHQMPMQKFIDNVVNYNPVDGITNLSGDVFQWAWSGVLGFIHMITVVGPITVDFIEIAGVFLAQLIYWLWFIVRNAPALLLSVESVIILAAVAATRKGKNRFIRVWRNFKNYNIAISNGVFWLAGTVKEWTLSIVHTVSSVVEALKPV